MCPSFFVRQPIEVSWSMSSGVCPSLAWIHMAGVSLHRRAGCAPKHWQAMASGKRSLIPTSLAYAAHDWVLYYCAGCCYNPAHSLSRDSYLLSFLNKSWFGSVTLDFFKLHSQCQWWLVVRIWLGIFETDCLVHLQPRGNLAIGLTHSLLTCAWYTCMKKCTDYYWITKEC